MIVVFLQASSNSGFSSLFLLIFLIVIVVFIMKKSKKILITVAVILIAVGMICGFCGIYSLGFNFSKKEDKKASAYGNLFKKD